MGPLRLIWEFNLNCEVKCPKENNFRIKCWMIVVGACSTSFFALALGATEPRLPFWKLYNNMLPCSGTLRTWHIIWQYHKIICMWMPWNQSFDFSFLFIWNHAMYHEGLSLYPYLLTTMQFYFVHICLTNLMVFTLLQLWVQPHICNWHNCHEHRNSYM